MGSGRGRLAVARIAAATSLVRGVACMGGLPNILERPAMVRRTPGMCARIREIGVHVGCGDRRSGELYRGDGHP